MDEAGERNLTLADGAETLRCGFDGPVAVVQLNRPQVRNALDPALCIRLQRTLEQLDDDPEVRAIVLTGAGRTFCSGDDLNVVRAASEADFRRAIERLQALTRCLVDLETPVVCALNGPALGAGLELALACDVRIAAPGFFCATPEVRLGLIATNAATVLLPLLIGPGRARRMLLGGGRVDAAWCLSAGLIDAIDEAETLLASALAWASEFAEAGPAALAASRRLLNAPLRAALGAALDQEADACVAAQASAEGREGVAAHFERRPPAWRPR
jgi:enoyl-CoA hydratase/carnithine racemase